MDVFYRVREMCRDHEQEMLAMAHFHWTASAAQQDDDEGSDAEDEGDQMDDGQDVEMGEGGDSAAGEGEGNGGSETEETRPLIDQVAGEEEAGSVAVVVPGGVGENTQFVEGEIASDPVVVEATQDIVGAMEAKVAEEDEVADGGMRGWLAGREAVARGAGGRVEGLVVTGVDEWLAEREAKLKDGDREDNPIVID